MYEYDPELDDPQPPAPAPTTTFAGRLCWLLIVMTFMSGIACNVLVLVYLFQSIFSHRGL